MADIVLNAEVRDRTGTGGARETRRAGLVPGIIYGGEKAPQPVAVRANEFRKALQTGKLMGHLVKLKSGKETQSVIAKVIDMHPVTDEPIHFDFYRVDAHQEIKIAVPVHFANQDDCPALKKGGTLTVAYHEVLLSCHADQIPEELLVDLTGLDIGSSIHVSDIQLPKGVTAAMDDDAVVATLAAPKVQVAEDEAADAETASEASEDASSEGDEA